MADLDMREIAHRSPRAHLRARLRLEQLRQNFSNLARCLTEFAQPGKAPLLQAGATPGQSGRADIQA